MTYLYNIPLKTIDGEEITLEKYRGKKLLIVNVASRCGFTPQYQGLEKLYRTYKDKLVVLGFPCNQFGGQEPGQDGEIKHFCETHYQLSFPLFTKIEVNGKAAHPLYVYLKEHAKGLLGSEAIKWNFTKFLVDEKGEVIKRYAPQTTPEKIASELNDLD